MPFMAGIPYFNQENYMVMLATTPLLPLNNLRSWIAYKENVKTSNTIMILHKKSLNKLA